jgi:hypothetical protein
MIEIGPQLKELRGKEMKKETTVITGRIFRVFFENIYRPNPQETPDSILSCVVIADTTEDAIRKVHDAFPGEEINSVNLDTDYQWEEQGKRPRGKTVIF